MFRLIAATLLIGVIIAPAAGDAFEDGLVLFQRAAEAREAEGPDSAKARETFREAARAWDGLVADGRVSTRLYTNIGNARAFAGDRGEAVLAYRRALLVDPANEQAREALASIRSALGIEGRDAGASAGVVHALFFWHDALSFGARRVLFGILWIGGLGLLLLARRRRRLFVPAGLCLAASVALLISLAITDADRSGERAAVLVTRVEGRTGDGEFYSPSHSAPLPAGAEVEVLERRGGADGWAHVRLRDGTAAWVPARAAAPVIP